MFHLKVERFVPIYFPLQIYVTRYPSRSENSARYSDILLFCQRHRKNTVAENIEQVSQEIRELRRWLGAPRLSFRVRPGFQQHLGDFTACVAVGEPIPELQFSLPIDWEEPCPSEGGFEKKSVKWLAHDQRVVRKQIYLLNCLVLCGPDVEVKGIEKENTTQNLCS